MTETACNFLTTGHEEQNYHCLHSQDLPLGPRRYFVNYCHRYDETKESNQFTIEPVLIDLEMPERSMTIDNFQAGEEPTRVNDLQMAEWMDKLIQ